jgi:hypothetical protein
VREGEGPGCDDVHAEGRHEGRPVQELSAKEIKNTETINNKRIARVMLECV